MASPQWRGFECSFLDHRCLLRSFFSKLVYVKGLWLALSNIGFSSFLHNLVCLKQFRQSISQLDSTYFFGAIFLIGPTFHAPLAPFFPLFSQMSLFPQIMHFPLVLSHDSSMKLFSNNFKFSIFQETIVPDSRIVRSSA